MRKAGRVLPAGCMVLAARSVCRSRAHSYGSNPTPILHSAMTQHPAGHGLMTGAAAHPGLITATTTLQEPRQAAAQPRQAPLWHPQPSATVQQEQQPPGQRSQGRVPVGRWAVGLRRDLQRPPHPGACVAGGAGQVQGLRRVRQAPPRAEPPAQVAPAGGLPEKHWLQRGLTSSWASWAVCQQLKPCCCLHMECQERLPCLRRSPRHADTSCFEHASPQDEAPAAINLAHLAREAPAMRVTKTSSQSLIAARGLAGRQFALSPSHIHFGEVRAWSVASQGWRVESDQGEAGHGPCDCW
jgi:hypothetical protein